MSSSGWRLVGVAAFAAAWLWAAGPAAGAEPLAHEAHWFARWAVEPQDRWKTEQLLKRSRIAERLDEGVLAARAGDRVANVLVTLELNRRCNGGKTISRADCAAFAHWLLGSPSLSQGVSPAARDFQYFSFRHEGWKARFAEIGQVFEQGIGGAPDDWVAKLFYELASGFGETDAEKAEAEYRLGLMWEEGRLGKIDLSLAETRYEAAANRGHGVAAYLLAQRRLARAGPGDKQAAAGFFRVAADAGVADAAWRYARMLETREVIERRGPEKLYAYYRMAALKGHVPAMRGVARAHRNGWGVPVDARAEEAWWTRAAEAGDAEAAWYVAGFHSRRDDFGGGLPWLRRAAQGGYPGAQEMLQQWLSKGVREKTLGNALLAVLEFVADVGAEFARQKQAEIAYQQAQSAAFIAGLASVGYFDAPTGGASLGRSAGGSWRAAAGGNGDSTAAGGSTGASDVSGSGGGSPSGHGAGGSDPSGSGSGDAGGGPRSDSASSGSGDGGGSSGLVIQEDSSAEWRRKYEADLETSRREAEARAAAAKARAEADSARQAAELKEKRRLQLEEYVKRCHKGSWDAYAKSNVSCQ